VIRPAAKKARDFERKHGNRQGVGRRVGKFTIPTRDEYAMVGEKLKIPRDVCDREYDKFLAARKNGKGAGHGNHR